MGVAQWIGGLLLTFTFFARAKWYTRQDPVSNIHCPRLPTGSRLLKTGQHPSCHPCVVSLCILLGQPGTLPGIPLSFLPPQPGWWLVWNGQDELVLQPSDAASLSDSYRVWRKEVLYWEWGHPVRVLHVIPTAIHCVFPLDSLSLYLPHA